MLSKPVFVLNILVVICTSRHPGGEILSVVPYLFRTSYGCRNTQKKTTTTVVYSMYFFISLLPPYAHARAYIEDDDDDYTEEEKERSFLLLLMLQFVIVLHDWLYEFFLIRKD